MEVIEMNLRDEEATIRLDYDSLQEINLLLLAKGDSELSRSINNVVETLRRKRMRSGSYEQKNKR